jgi:hypothetical protein
MQDVLEAHGANLIKSGQSIINYMLRVVYQLTKLDPDRG